MKNIIKVIKTNKGIIIQKGLIAFSAVAGLVIASLVFDNKVSDEDESQFDEAEIYEGSEDSEEE